MFEKIFRMKSWLVGTKWIQARGKLPPKQFYTQFQSKKGTSKLYNPDPQDVTLRWEASASGGGGQKINRFGLGEN